MKRLSLTGVVILLCLVGFNHPTFAAEGWRIQLTPYIWAPGTSDTEASISDNKIGVNLDFDDLVDLSAVGGMFHLEAWDNDQYGVIVDFIHLQVAADAEVETPGPTIEADAYFRMTIMELAVGFRIVRTPLAIGFYGSAGGGNPEVWFDIITGIRYTDLVLEADLDPGPEFHGSKLWTDPYVGIRFGAKVMENVTFIFRGDLGGFGLPGSSKHALNLVAGFDYQPWNAASIKLGYRIYDFEYETGSGLKKFELDTQIKGPALGVTFHF